MKIILKNSKIDYKAKELISGTVRLPVYKVLNGTNPFEGIMANDGSVNGSTGSGNYIWAIFIDNLPVGTQINIGGGESGDMNYHNASWRNSYARWIICNKAAPAVPITNVIDADTETYTMDSSNRFNFEPITITKTSESEMMLFVCGDTTEPVVSIDVNAHDNEGTMVAPTSIITDRYMDINGQFILKSGPKIFEFEVHSNSYYELKNYFKQTGIDYQTGIGMVAFANEQGNIFKVNKFISPSYISEFVYGLTSGTSSIVYAPSGTKKMLVQGIKVPLDGEEVSTLLYGKQITV